MGSASALMALELDALGDRSCGTAAHAPVRSGAPSMDDILLCGDDCVRCGACFGDAGESCSFEGASVSGGCRDVAVEEEYSRRGAMCGSMLDEKSLAAEVAELFEARGFPGYAARAAAEAAVATALEAWQPCRADGAIVE
jgi:hypothetical protein